MQVKWTKNCQNPCTLHRLRATKSIKLEFLSKMRPSYKKAFNPSARFNVYLATVTKVLLPVHHEVSIHLKNSSMIGFEYIWHFFDCGLTVVSKTIELLSNRYTKSLVYQCGMSWHDFCK